MPISHWGKGEELRANSVGWTHSQHWFRGKAVATFMPNTIVLSEPCCSPFYKLLPPAFTVTTSYGRACVVDSTSAQPPHLVLSAPLASLPSLWLPVGTYSGTLNHGQTWKCQGVNTLWGHSSLFFPLSLGLWILRYIYTSPCGGVRGSAPRFTAMNSCQCGLGLAFPFSLLHSF